jgi:tetratricopeptide (TPR) repeat protein
MSADPKASDYFIAGGTLRPDAPSYVKRPADDQLFNLAQAGAFCYVLTARQMGKSSLMTQTERRLREAGVSTATVDLTSIGSVAIDAWYLGLLTELTRQLGLATDPEAWWQERAALGQPQRFTNFLRDVVLAEIKGQVVIFIDEIDSTLNLDFADDFFATIRFTYNARAADAAYARLTFVLLGVATPSDLIKDASRTPFNVGQAIDLREFTWTNAQSLRQGLINFYPEQGEAILQRIFYWTNGHPYLTQKLCATVVKTRDGSWSESRIDELVGKLFLSEEAQNEDNLKFVQRNVEGIEGGQRRRLLGLYRLVYEEKKVKENQQSLDQNRLKLFGLVGAKNGTLQVRNEIYRRAFNLAWIKTNTQYDWSQIIARIAIAVALLVILLAGGIFWYNVVRMPDQAKEAKLNFYQAATPVERVSSLATLFELQGLFGTPDYDIEAMELFFGLPSWQEQSALFQIEDDRIVIVIKRLYVTLADVDNTNGTGPLLQVMAEALEKLEQTEETTILKDEIESWLQGRTSAQQNLEAALAKYDQAIKLNSDNLATLYERARILTESSQYEQALNDLDQVMAIAGRSAIPTLTAQPNIITKTTSTPTPSPILPSPNTPTPNTDVIANKTPTVLATVGSTSTPVLTETPTPTPIPVPVVSEFATTIQIINAVRQLLNNNPNLASVLFDASTQEYPNLREFGLVPIPTPTSAFTVTSTPNEVTVAESPIPLGTPSSTTNPSETSSATSTPNETITLELATSTNTASPTPIPAPITTTPTLPEAIVVANQINLRSGPGIVYDIIDSLSRGDVLNIRGRITSNDWIQVVSLNSGILGWVNTESGLIQINIDLNTIPIIEVPLTQTPLPAPVLIAPENGLVSIGILPDLIWEWGDIIQQEDYYYEVIIWLEGQPNPIDVAWVQYPCYRYDQIPEGQEGQIWTFSWTISVVKGIPANVKQWSPMQQCGSWANISVWNPGEIIMNVSEISEMRSVRVGVPFPTPSPIP